jgi:hypothetical protein
LIQILLKKSILEIFFHKEENYDLCVDFYGKDYINNNDFNCYEFKKKFLETFNKDKTINQKEGEKIALKIGAVNYMDCSFKKQINVSS